MNIKQYSLLTAAALMLAACSKNDDLGVPQNGNYPQDGVVRISTTVNELKTRSGEQPYTGADLSLSVNYGTSDKYTQPNVKWTTADNGTTWTPATQMLWKNATTATKIYAYAPHQASVTDLTAVPFTVAADQSAGLASSDLLGYFNNSFVPGSSLTTKNAMDINFSHKLSKLTINIAFGDQFATTPAITGVTVNGVQPTVSYNATSGYVSSTSGAATTIKMHPVSQTSYEVIIPPQSVGTAVQMLSVTLAGSAVKYSYTTPAGGHPFVSGSAYTMTLRVGKDKLEMESVTVSDWATGGIIPGGEAESTIEVSADTQTLTASQPGRLTPDHITAALDGGTVLAVRGTLNADDVAKLTATTSLTAIDLRGATYPAATRTVGTVPTADWSGCTALTKIIIDKDNAAAYEAAWSAVADKMLYLGKEFAYKVDAMTPYYADGIACVVTEITNFDTYQLITRNPYGADFKDGADQIWLTGTRTAGLCYNSLRNIITPWGGKVATLNEMEALERLRPNSFTEVKRAEGANNDFNLADGLWSFMINSDESTQYVTKYKYDKENRSFTLGWQYDELGGWVNYSTAFITFTVTNP